jgi:hypothetical protein
MSPQPEQRYAYGLRVRGVDGVDELPSAPVGRSVARKVVTVRQADTVAPPPVALDERRCVRLLPDGRHLALDRRRGTATFFGPPLTEDLLAHPYLGPIATTFNRWAGREAFHGGAFVKGDRAWAVLGPRTAGKSSLLAALASQDVPVLSDDILVVDGSGAYAGPRCVDLRHPIPGRSLDTKPVRNTTRLRLRLPPIPLRLPLGGWLFLRWGDELTMTSVGAAELLGRLAARRSWPQLPSDPAATLAIATLPAWDLTRPRDWNALGETCRLLDRVLRAVPDSCHLVATPGCPSYGQPGERCDCQMVPAAPACLPGAESRSRYDGDVNLARSVAVRPASRASTL